MWIIWNPRCRRKVYAHLFSLSSYTCCLYKDSNLMIVSPLVRSSRVLLSCRDIRPIKLTPEDHLLFIMYNLSGLLVKRCSSIMIT